MKGQRIERILGIVLAILLALAALLSSVLEGDPESPARSVHSTLGEGRRAAMLLLSELGHEADAWRQAPGAIPRSTQMIWLPTPPQTLGMESEDPDDPADERDFFASGPEGQALLGELHHPEAYYEFAEQGGVLVLPASESTHDFLVHQLDLLEFEDAFVEDPSLARGTRTIRLERTGEELVLRWRQIDPFEPVESGSPLELHYPDESGDPLAISLAIGAGRILVLGDDLFLDNDSIADADHALFLLRFVEEFASGGPVLFDEYALGRWKPTSADELAFQPPYKAVTLHLLVLLLVFVWRNSWVREFPRDPRAIERLSALARARSSASLMERAGRWDLLEAELRGGVLRRLSVFARLTLPEPLPGAEPDLEKRSELGRYAAATDELLDAIATRSGLEERLPVWREWLERERASGAAGLEAQAERLAAIEHEVEMAREQGTKRRSFG